MTQINWGEIIKEAADSGTSFEPLPVGDYNLNIKEASYKKAQSGRDMWKITTEVIDGPHARRRVWNNLVLVTENPTALGMFFRKMGALGLTQEFFAQNPDVDTIARAMIGRSFRGQVTQSDYQGKINNDIQMFYPISTQPGVSTTVAAPVSAPAPAVAFAPPVAAPAPALAPVVSAPVAPPAPAVAAPVGAPPIPGALPSAPF